MKKSYANTSDLKKQVEQVKDMAMDSIKKMSENPDISIQDYINGINKAAKAFKIMDSVIELGEQMKELKDE